MECLGILLLGLIDDLNAVVIAAVLANAVSQLLFVALGALNDAGQLELPVGTARTTAGLGHFPLGRAMVTPPHSVTRKACPGFKIVRFREPVSGENLWHARCISSTSSVSVPVS